ncbi:acylphosphatase [Marinobacter segnicrescens]|uniref:acylphosphatase n=1 Tax=Marinobacter segnicrescens TaxID=430453 RepID=A0A1I0B6L9_9GAMM|nr:MULTISPECIES: acylphosphatase [Marinobacter]UZD66934.1 acylphosphatase [Marinobacter sp. AN1]SET01680.1 acylphosphatase [Marinobacter segnicrescens]
MDTQQRHLMVEGHVQGVSYRAYTERHASELGLEGYVRNLTDGRVEIVAEGPLKALDELEEWCWQGPPAAKVSAVRAETRPASGGFSGFVIR